MPRIAVVILTWNGRVYLPHCFQALHQQTIPTSDYQLIVIDNNSTDDSVPWLYHEYPDLPVQVLAENIGFAAGNNIGIKQALADPEIEYVVLLNQDTKVYQDWLEQLIRCAEAHPDAGIIQSKVLYGEEAYRIDTVGNPLHPLGFSWAGGYKELSSQHQHDVEITLASGASMLVRRDVFERIGLLDERLFAYHEDVDFSWRARLAGFTIWLASESKTMHYHQFSIGGKKFLYSERNRLVTYFSHYRLWTLIVLGPIFLVTEIAMLGYATLMGWLGIKLQSYVQFLELLLHVLHKRQQTKKIRVVSDRVMMRSMTTVLNFSEVATPLLQYGYNPLFRLYYWFVRWLIV